MIISVFDRVENIVGKGEIACTSNFSFSHNVFKRLLSQRHQKVSLCWNGLNRSKPEPVKIQRTIDIQCTGTYTYKNDKSDELEIEIVMMAKNRSRNNIIYIFIFISGHF